MYKNVKFLILKHILSRILSLKLYVNEIYNFNYNIMIRWKNTKVNGHYGTTKALDLWNTTKRLKQVTN